MAKMMTDAQYENPMVFGDSPTRTFAQIIPTLQDFLEIYDIASPTITVDSTPTSYTITEEQAKLVYPLLYGKYAGSSIASDNEQQFLYRLSSIIAQYGPVWFAKLDMQRKIRELDTDDLVSGAISISNSALHPSTAPPTSSSEFLPKIDAQNVNIHKRSPVEGLALKWGMLQQDTTEEFLDKFKPLFIKGVVASAPLWYFNETDEQEVGQ